MKKHLLQIKYIKYLFEENLKMKFTILLLMVSFFQIKANTSYAHEVKISLNLKNETLENVLNKIEVLTSYKFMYKDNDLDYKKNVSINVEMKPLSFVLKQLFDNTNISYIVSNNQIVLKPKALEKTILINKAVENHILTGVVLDEKGLTLPGANVIEKGTQNSTVTDFDGKFTIKLSNKNAVVVVSFIGLVSQEIKVNGQAQIKVTLKDNLSLLNEIVVVGYGKQKKESVVGSITQIKGSDLLRTGNVATISEALTGLMAGVSTQQAAGQPGATKATILIRGQSTWGSNDPTFIVDGIERDFNSIDPNEIESISVLKDASATAVFGVKGANGVVVVTTKHGKKGKAKVSVTSSWGFKEPTMDTEYYKDYATTLEYYNIAAMNDRNYSDLQPQSLIDKWRDPNRDKRFYTYTTWIEELLGKGTASQYNINVSGGNDFVQYFTSLGYQYDGDIMNLEKQKDFDPRTYERKYNWRSNVDFNLTKSTKFQVSLSGNFKNWNGNSITASTTNPGITNGNGDAFSRIWQTPLIGPIPELEDGRLTTVAGASVNPNFIRMEKEGQFVRRSNEMFSDFTLSQDLSKDFKIKGRLSYNFNQRYKSSIVQTPLLQYIPNADNTDFILEGDPNAVQVPVSVKTEAIDGSNNILYYELSMNYDKTLGDHKITALGLFNRRQSQVNNKFSRFEEAWVARATYDYKGKYLAEFNGSYTGNENWAPGLRFGFFPSMAAGWVLSNEEFFKNNLGFFNKFKIRYSYGKIGSDKGIGDNDRFLYQSTYDKIGNTANYGQPIQNYGSSLLLEGRIPVLDNTWETSIKQDLGVEFAVFKNRLNATVEFFNELRTDILLQRNTVAPWLGNQAPYANMGETKNHGIDIDLKWNAPISKNLSYFVNLNMSLSENRVIERDDPVNTPNQTKNEGKPLGWRSGLIRHGLYQSWDDVYNSTASSFTTDTKMIPGTSDYVDYNGDGVIDQFDKVPIGNPTFATKTYAFSFGVTYKSFTIHALFNGMWDISKYLDDRYMFEYESANTFGWQLLNNHQLDAWSVDNPNGQHPALRTARNSHDNQVSTYNTRSAAFLRFKTIELKYKVNEKLLKKMGLFDSFELFANGNNLYTWSDLPSLFDPEQKELAVYPITKRYNLGLRLSF